jgi:hypothetical protein
MPRGPKGEKRPADVIGNAVQVMRIATGEIDEHIAHVSSLARQKRAQKGGLKGGPARAKKLSPEERREIAQRAAKTRWAK